MVNKLKLTTTTTTIVVGAQIIMQSSSAAGCKLSDEIDYLFSVLVPVAPRRLFCKVCNLAKQMASFSVAASITGILFSMQQLFIHGQLLLLLTLIVADEKKTLNTATILSWFMYNEAATFDMALCFVDWAANSNYFLFQDLFFLFLKLVKPTDQSAGETNPKPFRLSVRQAVQ